jgi:hypothetical protein
MTHGDTKSHRVRSGGGRSSRSRGYSYRSSSRSRSTYVMPQLTPAETAARDAQWAQEKLDRQQSEVDNITIMQQQSVRLTGFLHSEIAQAIAVREKHDLYEGDFLDDPVEAVQGRAGFAEEYRVSRGVKLLVNIAIDCSNSMTHNNVDEASKIAAYTLYAMLDNVSKMLPDDTVTVNVWQWARHREGNGVSSVKPSQYHNNPLISDQQQMVQAIQSMWMDGEDTYIAPLFQSLYNWEARNGWQSEARLDIVLTDGVLEHKKDRSEATKWQLARDGGLTTVLLNFLPIADWADVYLPDRCFQYEATADNVFTLMSKVLGEWVILI